MAAASVRRAASTAVAANAWRVASTAAAASARQAAPSFPFWPDSLNRGFCIETYHIFSAAFTAAADERKVFYGTGNYFIVCRPVSDFR